MNNVWPGGLDHMHEQRPPNDKDARCAPAASAPAACPSRPIRRRRVAGTLLRLIALLLPACSGAGHAAAQPVDPWVLEKTANPTEYSNVGDIITYTYVVTNNTDFTGQIFSFVDDHVSPVNCPSSSIPHMGTLTCTGTYVITAADVAALSVTNSATVSGDLCGECGPVDASDQATVTLAAQPAALTLDKIAQTPTFARPGDIIDYDYVVTNSGAATITSAIFVTDDRVSSVSCPALPGGDLTPGESITCLGSYTISNADFIAGSVTNTAVASDGTVVSNTDTETVVRDNAAVRQQSTSVIRRFLDYRTSFLFSEEPDRPRLARRLPGSLWGAGGNGAPPAPLSFTAQDTPDGDVTFSASLSGMAAAFGEARQGRLDGPGGPTDGDAAIADPGFDAWVEGHFSHFNGDIDTTGDLGVIYFGTDYLVSSAALVGVLAQLDWATAKSATLATRTDGHGWMVGPYTTIRLLDELFFDARFAWGRSDNSVSPFMTYTDDFETDRWLARANLTGNWQNGNWRFTPSASIAYIEELQDAYTDSLGILIPGQTVSLGRVTVGPEIAYRHVTPGGVVVEPHVSLEGIWNFDQGSPVSISGFNVGSSEFQGRVEGGLLVRGPQGLSARAVATVDGIGASDFDAIGGEFWINLPLN